MRYSNMINSLNSIPTDQQIGSLIDIPECLRFLAYCEANHVSGERINTEGFFLGEEQFHLMVLSIGRHAPECFQFKYFMETINGRIELSEGQIAHMFEDHPEMLDDVEVELRYV